MKPSAKLLCLAGWILNASLHVYYLVQSKGATVLAGVNVSPEMSSRQVLGTGWILFGLLISAVAFLGKKISTAAVLLSSLAYLIVWYATGPFPTTGLSGGYRLAWTVATKLGLYPSVIIRDVLLPALLLSVLARLLYSAVLRANGKTVLNA